MSVAIPTSLKIRLLERGYVSFRAWARQHEVSFETARDIASGRISCARNPKRGSARHVLEIMINDLGYDPREHHKQAA